MDRDQIRHLIQRSTDAALLHRGDASVALSDSTRLLGGEDLTIDSLDLAVIVTDLEEEIGVDPFEDGFIPFATVGDLIELFHDRIEQASVRG